MSYEKILTLLETLPGEQSEFKNSLKPLIQALNQDKGKASADILKFKQQLSDLQDLQKKNQEQTSTYKEIAEALTKAGVDAKDHDALMEKLNVKKSLEDENTTLKELLSKANEGLKGFETKEQAAARRNKVDPMFQKAQDEFVEAKRKEGNPNFRLADNFVDKETLYKDVDIDNDTLRNDHFTKVLQEAATKQQNLMEATGMDFTKEVHKQGTPKGHYQNNGGINEAASEAITSVRKSGGTMDSVVNGIAQIQAAQKKS